MNDAKQRILSETGFSLQFPETRSGMEGMALNTMIIRTLSEIGFVRQKNFERTAQPALRVHFHSRRVAGAAGQGQFHSTIRTARRNRRPIKPVPSSTALKADQRARPAGIADKKSP